MPPLRCHCSLAIKLNNRSEEGKRESHKYSLRCTNAHIASNGRRQRRRGGKERKRERARRDQARFGESSHVNAIVNVMRIARKIKYRHGHLSLPFPQLTSSIEFRNSCKPPTLTPVPLTSARVCRKEKKNSYFTNLLFRGKGERNKGRDVVEKKKKEKDQRRRGEEEEKYRKRGNFRDGNSTSRSFILWPIEFNGYNNS